VEGPGGTSGGGAFRGEPGGGRVAAPAGGETPGDGGAQGDGGYSGRMARTKQLTHVDAAGAARMVDVSAKPETARRASAHGFVKLSAEALRLVRTNAVKKGDVLATARLAGISATKRTADLIPLCHPLRIDGVRVDVRATVGGIAVEAEVTARDRTGVEMEALTAVAVACLTIYDMVKAVDRGASIRTVEVVAKEGGASGRWRRRAR